MSSGEEDGEEEEVYSEGEIEAGSEGEEEEEEEKGEAETLSQEETKEEPKVLELKYEPLLLTLFTK